MPWAQIPAELRALPQWCIAGPDKIPMYVTEDGALARASVIDPNTWMAFEDAAEFAFEENLALGFVLSETDPYTCIDLDVKTPASHPGQPEKWTPREHLDRYKSIIHHFACYSEISIGGNGVHVWARGNIGSGVRRDGVELYSQQRFIICTGNVMKNLPISDRQEMLSRMVAQMHAPELASSAGWKNLEELPEDEDDWSILLRATRAENAMKFATLWRGEWESLGYPSQSEADLALMAIIAFYSKSNSQCRRIFRESALGKRDKATKNDVYLNRTLSAIRAQELQLKDIKVDLPVIIKEPPSELPNYSLPEKAEPTRIPRDELAFPPGLAGRIADFIYRGAPRPVKEVAIVAALGLLAGICGKAWHIPQSGLNMYIILVARSAIGKEAMHSGLSAITQTCGSQMPAFHSFVDFTDYASGPALMKACAVNPSFVNVSGEWGRKLRRLSGDDRDGPLSTLRTQMINLYQKSGPQSTLGGIGYSNRENNILSVSGVAYSMIGETTPVTFYDSLTDSMMEDGFLSRFLIVEYDGARPQLNRNASEAKLEENTQKDLLALAFRAQTIIASGKSQLVERDDAASEILDAFETECDVEIDKAGDEEARRQMWNRAALKVLRCAALLAVADAGAGDPCIRKEHVEWALNVVRRDIAIMARRLDSGDVGRTDYARERKILSILDEYLDQKVSHGYNVPKDLYEARIIPRGYLQKRTSSSSAFVNHRLGHNSALENSIQSLIANGQLVEVDKMTLLTEYRFRGKAYLIVRA